MPPVAFFSLPTRAWELAVGGLVALTAGQWRRLPALAAAIAGWAGLGVILLACTRLSAATPYPGTAALLPVLGAALVIGAGCAAPARGVGRVLALRPMRAIGRVSYSWYLWHWPLLQVAPAVSDRPFPSGRALTAVLRLPWAGRADSAFHREPAALRRSAAPVGQPQSRALAAPPPRSQPASAWHCWYGCLSRSAAVRRLRR